MGDQNEEETMEQKYRYLAVRHTGGELDSYVENGQRIIPEVEEEKLVVLSKHEQYHNAVMSVERNWRDTCQKFLDIANGMPFFVVEINPEIQVKVGEVISSALTKDGMNRKPKL